MQRCRMLATGIPVGVSSGPGSCPNMGPGIGVRTNEDETFNVQRHKKASDLFNFQADDDIQSDRGNFAKVS